MFVFTNYRAHTKIGRSARLELTGCGFLPGLKIHEVKERLKDVIRAAWVQQVEMF